MKNLVLSIICLLCITTIVSAKTYKVNNPDEFKKAAGVAVPGDEIIIANGNYSNWETDININGTETKPIIIRAETVGKVVFFGEVNKPVFRLTGKYAIISGLNFSGCTLFRTKEETGILIELKDAVYCRVTNCTFTKNVVKTQFMPIVMVSGNGNNNRVDHCSFVGNIDNQELQVKVTGKEVPQYTLIDNNIFKDKDSVSWKVYNGGECIQIGQDPVLLGNQVARSVVRDNRFIRCNGEPEVISNKSSGNSYIHNYFEDCHGELVMRGGHDCLIDSNIFKGGIGGIRVNGTHHTITNNIFTGLPVSIRFMYGMAKGKTETGFYIAASNCLVKTNTITKGITGILIGDSKNADWTGKFDTKKYPSRTIQDVSPFDITLIDNSINETQVPIKHNEAAD